MSALATATVIQTPTELFEWIGQQAGNLRTTLGRAMMQKTFTVGEDLVITQNGVWAPYAAVSAVTYMPEFVNLQHSMRLQLLQLFLQAKFGINTPTQAFQALPETGKLEIPVQIFGNIHIDVCMRKLPN